MNKKLSVTTALGIAGGIILVLLTIMVVVPLLNEVVKIEVSQTPSAVAVQTPLPEKPEELLVTVFYEMEKDSKKISDIYIEVFHVGNQSVSYLQIPADTRVTLSEELYKSLQAYAPELPQYLKLSNMAEGFSKEYGLTGCNRILSEVLGMSVNHYVRTEAGTLENWWKVLQKKKTAKEFFEKYTSWVEGTSSDLSVEARWMYFESWQKVGEIIVEQAPGTQEKDGYLLSGKRSRERLQELMAGKKATAGME